VGDPKKLARKFDTPRHPWQADRIKEEITLVREFGLSNKKEVWRTSSLVKNWRERAKKILRLTDERRKQAEDELFGMLLKLNILQKGAKLDDVLAITTPEVLERRLQTQIYKQSIANTVKQARQYIVHNKIFVNGKLINSPSYLVKKEDKLSISAKLKPVAK